MGTDPFGLHFGSFHSLYALHLCVSLLFPLRIPCLYCSCIRETFCEKQYYFDSVLIGNLVLVSSVR